FRRERPHAQLTELGQRMYPLLKQCYESALGARSLASAIKSGELGTLRLALSRTINLDLLTLAPIPGDSIRGLYSGRLSTWHESCAAGIAQQELNRCDGNSLPFLSGVSQKKNGVAEEMPKRKGPIDGEPQIQRPRRNR